MLENLLNSQTVSVIIPCYNVEKYLNKCIRSLLRQTHKHIEVLLIDDGSTDKTPVLCDKWSAKDSRIRVFHKRNGGVSSARNVGLKNATGEYITFVDPDDWIDKHMIEIMLSASLELQSDVIGCGFYRWCLGIKSKRMPPLPKNILFDSDFIKQQLIKPLVVTGKFPDAVFNSTVKLYRSSLLTDSNILFDETWDHAEDIKFTLSVLQSAQSICFIDNALYYYAKHLTAKSLTSRVSPNNFARRVRYHLFIDELALQLFGMSESERNTPATIINYAHEEAVAICKNSKNPTLCQNHLRSIFNSPEYKNAITKCTPSALPKHLATEVENAKNDDFISWHDALKKTIP